jgi:hypothetical protein
MVRHTGFLTTIAGLGLAVLLAPASGCSPSAMPDTTTHPADPQAPAGAAAPEVADAPDQQAPDAHAGHGAHGGSGAPADATEPMTHDQGAHDHGTHAGHGAQAPSPEPEPSGEALLAAEQDAYQRAKPVFDKYCAKCHSKDGKKARKATLAHFSMDTYPFGGHHETEMGEEVREVLGVTGKRPTMPQDQPGIVQGDELALLVTWSEAFDTSHAAGLHQHGDAHGAGHQHGAEKQPAKVPARGSDKKKPAPEKKPDATHQHGKEHEGHQHGQHHGNGHEHGHH